MGLLEVQDLAVHFRARDKSLVKAVDGVSFSIDRGRILGLVGESGSGKTTTGRAVLRLVEAIRGKVFFEGRDLLSLPESKLRPLRRRFQMIFQDPYGSLDPRMSAFSIIEEALVVHGIGSKRERRDRVIRLMQRVGLDETQAARFPHEFSGGQRQRIAIARALILEPSLVIADEPVSALDVSIQAQVINLLQDLTEEMGLAMLFIAHDISVVSHIADETAVMYLGQIVESGPCNSVFGKPLHPYTYSLISAVPSPRPGDRKRRVVLAGETPGPHAVPDGCPLHPRCPAADSTCAARRPRPAETDKGSGHFVACHHADFAVASLEA